MELITHVLREFQSFPVEQKSAFKIGAINNKTLNGESPKYLQDIIYIYIHTSDRTLKSLNKHTLHIPRIKTEKI